MTDIDKEVKEEVVDQETVETATVENETTEQENDQEVVEEATEEIVEEVSELDKLKAENAELKDKNLRLRAEFDNFRKRTIKEKASMYTDGLTETVEKLLPVIDNFDRAISSAQDKEDNFFKGVEMINKQFNEILTALGVTAIEAVGQEFDANLHFAVQHEENENFGENTVCEEMQKGYMYKEKVIRPSMVKVAN